MNYEIYKIKMYQIIECIDCYTSEPSMNILINQMKKALEENDIEIIKFINDEFIIWYKNNINNIMVNEYVTNKPIHKHNVEELNKLKEYIEENSEEIKSRIKVSVSNLQNNINEIMILMNRFHLVVKQLRQRHNSRATLDVSDEYDVQDLLHSLLYILFDDIRTEEWTPSYAGKCSRQDFLIKDRDIVIEIKKTRNGLSAKELSDQLIIDITRYKTHPNCKTLICFVYDPEERIINPIGIENDLTENHDNLNVIVKIVQK